ncbi:MAG TPA: DUF5979 domain-containing protein, partial [Anaerolineaceae bacterium]
MAQRIGASRYLRTLLPLFLVLVLLLGVSLPKPAAAQIEPPTIASDQLDYPPGAWVTLNGTGWQGDGTVHLQVLAEDDSWQHEGDAFVQVDGTITYGFFLPLWYVPLYNVIATGNQTGRTATTTFTDLSIGTYDQCSNDAGNGYATGDTGCRWITGNLQSNNSKYYEGDSTVQRLWLTDFVPGSTHTVTFRYGTTKGGKHAYDFLTSWNWSENWITLADRCQDITGCTTAAETTVNIPQDPNVPDAYENATGTRQFVMRGGTLNSATTPVIASGTYSGDSETAITINFTVANSGPLCSTKQGVTTCGVAVWFGAHVASQADWGIGTGAGSITGSPYHVELAAIDGTSIGQRDNQMQSGVIVPNGKIIIVKDAVPNDPQDFSFRLTNNTTFNQTFSLDDDSDPTLSNTKSFSVAPGIYTASELNIPAGWSLTNLVCVDPSNNTTVNLGTGVATINLASGETVTCTYTDSRNLGNFKITKQTSNPDGAMLPAAFSGTYDCGTGYTGNWSVANGGSQTINNIPVGNTCTVSETAPAAIPGYTWAAATYEPTSVVISTKEQTFEIVVKNAVTRDRGSLEVTKVINWNNNTPEAVTFEICVSGPSFNTPDCKTVQGAETVTWTNLVTGEYTVSEQGVETSRWTVSVDPAGGKVQVVKDGTAKATVTNTFKVGGLEVTKVVDWNGYEENPTQAFEICIEGPVQPTSPVKECKMVSAATGWKVSWTNLEIGMYVVKETDPGEEWVVTGSDVPVLVTEQGAQQSVTITNTRKLGSLTVTKEILWAGAPVPTVSFTICIAGPSYETPNCKVFSPTNLVQTWTNLVGGEYTVTEPG